MRRKDMKKVAKLLGPLLAAFNQSGKGLESPNSSYTAALDIGGKRGVTRWLHPPPPPPKIQESDRYGKVGRIDPLEDVIGTLLFREAQQHEKAVHMIRRLRGAAPVGARRGGMLDELNLEEFALTRKWGVIADTNVPGRFVIPRTKDADLFYGDRQIERDGKPVWIQCRKPLKDGTVQKAAKRLRRWIKTAAEGNHKKLIRRLEKRKLSVPDQVAFRLLKALCILRPYRCHICKKVALDTSGKKNRMYCLRRCIARRQDGVKANRARRGAEDISRAQKAIRSWDDRGNWKEWVAGRTKLTPKFLTQAVNRGDLRPPSGINR